MLDRTFINNNARKTPAAPSRLRLEPRDVAHRDVQRLIDRVRERNDVARLQLDDVAGAQIDLVEPNSDLQASPELRHRILGTLLRRTCREAWARAGKDS